MKNHIFWDFFIIFILIFPPIFSTNQNIQVINGFSWTSIVIQGLTGFALFLRIKKLQSSTKKNIPFAIISIPCIVTILIINWLFWNYIASVSGFVQTNTAITDQPILKLCLGIFAAAFYEEALYRFYAPLITHQLINTNNLTKSKIKFIAAEFFVVLLFALAHKPLGLLGILHSFTAGIFLRIAVIKNIPLICVTAAHAAFNLLTYINFF